MVGNRGRGFEIAQGRLGPGRIHHFMRTIGQAEKALELRFKRSLDRRAFNKRIAQLGVNYVQIAEARIKIEQALLLCLKTAWMMDRGDPRAAASWISQIKVVAPTIALKIAGQAVQMFGAEGDQPGYTTDASLDKSAHPAIGRRSGCRSSQAGRTEEIG